MDTFSITVVIVSVELLQSLSSDCRKLRQEKKENKNNNMMHVRVDFASSFLSAIIEHALVTLSPATLPQRMM